jgi:hypothetical protein
MPLALYGIVALRYSVRVAIAQQSFSHGIIYSRHTEHHGHPLFFIVNFSRVSPDKALTGCSLLLYNGEGARSQTSPAD